MTRQETNEADIRLLHELLSYEPESGILRWKERAQKHFSSKRSCSIFNSRFSGKRAGGIAEIKGKKYRHLRIQNRNFRASRIAWAMHYGKWPENQIDHIDGDSLNDAIHNLRDVTCQENLKNRLLRKNNKSGCPGVSWDSEYSKWRARIGVDGKKINLGRFEDLESAIAAKKQAEREYGFHPNHGKPTTTNSTPNPGASR